MCTSSVSNVIYHTFSYSAAFYMLNGKNVNIMLELLLKGKKQSLSFKSCLTVKTEAKLKMEALLSLKIYTFTLRFPKMRIELICDF